LRDVALAPQQEQRAELLGRYGLERAIEQHAAVALPVDVSGAPEALRDVVRRMTAGRTELTEFRFDVQPPRIDTVVAETEALVPVATLVGAASVELK
jgi:hypothetical protein